MPFELLPSRLQQNCDSFFRHFSVRFSSTTILLSAKQRQLIDWVDHAHNNLLS